MSLDVISVNFYRSFLHVLKVVSGTEVPAIVRSSLDDVHVCTKTTRVLFVVVGRPLMNASKRSYVIEYICIYCPAHNVIPRSMECSTFC